MLNSCLLLILSLFLSISGFAQERFIPEKDLQPAWLTYGDNGYSPFDPGKLDRISSIYFLINNNEYPNGYLQVHTPKQFFLFVNGSLLDKYQGIVRLNLDSLTKVYATSSLTISIYQSTIKPGNLETSVVSLQPLNPGVTIDKKPDSFLKDFVVTAGLILIIFFAVIIRVHPKLAADYFSVMKILSLREGEDNQAHARFALSSNVLFYIFCSLLTGLYLLIIFYHLPEKYLITLDFRSTSFFGILWQWIKISILVLMLLILKLTAVFALSNLFGIKGIAGIHFFNNIRVLLVVTSTLSVVLFIYFISHGQDIYFYITLLSILLFALILWIVLVFLKLSNRIEHSMFHLFSYICATEVIPLLLTAKVLFQ